MKHLLSTIILCSLTLVFGKYEVRGNEPLAPEIFIKASENFTGDYREMKKRRLIRFLIPYSKTFFFFDGATPKGLSFEAAQYFEKYINELERTGNVKIHAIVLPTSREDLFDNLQSGKGDIAIGNLTITPKRLLKVDFCDPLLTKVNEVVVTPTNLTKPNNLFDLVGKTIHVRKSSSYYESLLALNRKFEKETKGQIKINIVDENLEDEDILEMVNAGIVDYTVVDNHKAHFWENIFPNIHVHNTLKVNEGGNIAWAIRKNSPELQEVVNAFVKDSKKGTLLGNIIFNKYLKNTKYITNSLNSENVKRYQKLSSYFKKYGNDYELDHLFLAALAYQESRLDQNTVSHVGAVGIMQLLPSTASDRNVNIPDIYNESNNIHAGTKYLRFLADRYFPPSSGVDTFNRGLFAIASYNAGPAKVTRLRKEAKEAGLNPNKWFHNVEIIAAKRIGRETVQYVSNILKYYVGYKMLEEKMINH